MVFPSAPPGAAQGGRLAQRESASFTPKRSLVRSQYRPHSSEAVSLSGEAAFLIVRGESGDNMIFPDGAGASLKGPLGQGPKACPPAWTSSAAPEPVGIDSGRRIGGSDGGVLV